MNHDNTIEKRIAKSQNPNSRSPNSSSRMSGFMVERINAELKILDWKQEQSTQHLSEKTEIILL